MIYLHSIKTFRECESVLRKNIIVILKSNQALQINRAVHRSDGLSSAASLRLSCLEA